MPVGEFPTITCESQAAWEEWLRDHHESADGVWIKMAKKGTGIASVNWAEAVQVALCYGWIDGQSRRVDDSCFVQKFTPRRKRSIWSKVNVEKATALIQSGRMQPAGLREVERAKADGRWEAAYEGQKTSTVPDDLQRELDARPNAKAFFAELNSQNRNAILSRLQDAKKPETRARRLAEFVALLEAGETIYPPG